MRPVTLRVACAQLTARPWEEASAALRDIQSALAAARDHGAALVVFPECSYPAYVVPQRPRRAAIPSEDEVVAAIARRVRRHRMTVVIGVACSRAGELYNEALVIEPDGSLAGTYVKACLWSQDHRWFRAGSGPRVIPTAWGPIGVMICADGRYPEIARSLVAAGAWLICDPTAWVGWGPSYDRIPNIQADCMLRVRAAENGVWVAAADKCGSERGALVYAGRSQILSPEGRAVALASPGRAEVISADVVLAPARPFIVALSPQQRSRLSRTTRRARRATRNPSTFRLGLYQGTRRRARCAFAALRAQGADVLFATADPPTRVRRTLHSLRGVRCHVLQGRDMLAPEPARAAALAGADVIVWLRPPSTSRILDYARTRAAENRVYVVVCTTPSSAAAACLISPHGTVTSSSLLGIPSGFLGDIDTRLSRNKQIAFATPAFAPKNLHGIVWLDRRRGIIPA